MELIQITAGLSGSDGVGSVVKTLDRLFKKNDYKTRIITEALNEQIIAELEAEETVIFYHAAFTIDPLITSIRCRKVMVFHNITFPEFFEGYDARLRTLARFRDGMIFRKYHSTLNAP